MTDPYNDAPGDDDVTLTAHLRQAGGPSLADRIETTRRKVDAALDVEDYAHGGSPEEAFDPDQLIGPDDVLPGVDSITDEVHIRDASGAIVRTFAPPPLADVTAFGEDTLLKVREGLRQVLGSEQVITDCIAEMQNRGILFREMIAPETDRGSASDGHHTFDELYEHRRALTAVLATIGSINGDSWRSKAHHPTDEPMFDGSFIVGIELPSGPISYHYPLESWDEFEAVPVLEHAPKWDGAGPPETIVRLRDFTAHLKQAIDEGHAVQEQAREAADTVVEAAQEQADRE